VGLDQVSSGDVLHRFRILPASYLLRHDHFGRMQDSDIEWMDPRRCWLLIFVSHRWETPEQPDPPGRQYRALAALVTGLCDLWDALIAEHASERIRLVPRLDRHGTAQAAVLLSRLNPADGAGRRSLRGSARRVLPEHIGIWYDYACLPQAPRTPGEEAAFRADLLALPELLGAAAVILVALREANHDYGTRAWCLAEALLTANKTGSQGVAVRMDLFGTSLAAEPADDTSSLDISRRLHRALDGWADVRVGPAQAADCMTMLAVAAGHSPSDWFAFSDGILPVYLGDVVKTAATWLGLVLARLGGDHQPVDLAAILRELAERARVRCAVDNDLVYVTLLMLHGETAPDTAMRSFYQECLRRHLSGKPVVVRATRSPGQFLSYEDLRLEFD
jgi:hypothetical protein